MSGAVWVLYDDRHVAVQDATELSGRIGIATCGNGDKFDIYKGIKIAILRMQMNSPYDHGLYEEISLASSDNDWDRYLISYKESAVKIVAFLIESMMLLDRYRGKPLRLWYHLDRWYQRVKLHVCVRFGKMSYDKNEIVGSVSFELIKNIHAPEQTSPKTSL